MTTVERKERDSLFFVSPSSNWQIESAADIDLIVRTGILPALSSFRSDSEGITWRERERDGWQGGIKKRWKCQTSKEAVTFILVPSVNVKKGAALGYWLAYS